MSDKTKEQISAMLDDECLPAERSRLLDRMGEGELRQTWDRYHLIGDVMRGEGVRLSGGGIADRVRQELEGEPAILAVPKPERSSEPHPYWLKPTAGAALAASVAVLAVLTVPGFMDSAKQGNGVGVQVAESTAPLAGGGGEPPALTVAGTRWKNLSRPEAESRLNRYLVDHSEYASPGGMGVLPYATFVGYDSSRP